jgi:predicted transcriptional regulator
MVYWPELIAEGLIDEESGAYNTTGKGIEWMKRHANLSEIEELEPGLATLLPRSR